MFHLTAYTLVSGAAAQTNADVPSVNDAIITSRNSHFILTDDFRLMLAAAMSATMTSARLNAPSINAFARHHIWPFDAATVEPAVVVDLPAVADYMDAPIKLPIMEEVGWEVTNTAVIAETFTILNWLMTPDHRAPYVPPGLQRLAIKASYAITSVARAWTGPGAITFAENLRGGWYSIVGMAVEDPNTIAARLLFPRGRMYDGRVLRPGVLVQNAYIRRPFRKFMGGVGIYGKFHSFEAPQVEILATNAAAHTGDLQLDLVYHGDAEPSGQ